MASRDPALHTAAITALEFALNRALELDPASVQRLQALDNSVFQVECLEPRIDFFMTPRDGKIALTGVFDGEVTTRVRGSARDFAQLASAQDPTAELINGGIELHGESAPLLELQAIVADLDLDWEAPLVGNLGDVVGHQLAQGLRGLFSLGRSASVSLERQLEEFIHEEARLAPPRLEVEDFYQDVAELNQQVERLQARIRRLTETAKPS